MRILIVDDDAKLRRLLVTGLEELGHRCAVAASAEEARRELEENRGGYDVMLLDVMMPGESGLELLERIRGGGDETAVIFLSARRTLEDRVRGLELGADDYLVKPFELRELLARIDAVVRRGSRVPAYVFGRLQIDPAHRTVAWEGTVIPMAPKEFDVLLALAEARGGVVSRPELLRQVWSMDFDPGTNVVEVQVANLRRKMERVTPRVVATVTGAGYRLDVERT